MQVRFDDDDLDRLETDARFTAKLPSEIVTSYRKALNWIRQATTEQDIRAKKSFHYEKMENGQVSLRLNLQWRLLIEIEGEAPDKVIVICSVENHYKD